jgi:hypothetical protein
MYYLLLKNFPMRSEPTREMLKQMKRMIWPDSMGMYIFDSFLKGTIARIKKEPPSEDGGPKV